jgi:predicted transcriptional regulator of viral defense system
MDNRIALLYKSKRTVFTTKDLSLLWRETDNKKIKASVAYFISRGALQRVTRGVFVLDTTYNKRELAASIYSPSYISFQTVLRDGGVIFQYTDNIFVAGPWPTLRTLGGTTIHYRKLKDVILYNSAGVTTKEFYSIATVERAFLDTIYLSTSYHLDNLRPINWEKCFELAPLYKNTKLTERLHSYHQLFLESEK